MVNPCLTTVFTAFDIGTVTLPATHGVLTQKAGERIETAFNEPAHSEGTEVNSQSICGAISYSVVYRADDSAQTLVTVEEVTP